MRGARDCSRETGRLECAPHFRMRSSRRLSALGLARALRAGAMQPGALLARGVAALGAQPTWLGPLIEELFPLPQTTWLGMSVADLADHIESSVAFGAASDDGHAPTIRRWILRFSSMHPAPLGLHDLLLPQLDHTEALAQWLGVSLETLRWFTACPPRRRHADLQRQHYAFRLLPKRSGGGRLIEAPRSRLKALQRRILDGLLDAVPVHEACHGFTRDRSVLTHARVHVGQPVVIRFDLMNFFASITAAQVRATFQTLGYPAGVAQDLTALCTLLTPEPVIARLQDDGWLDWHQARCLRSPHLAQGAPSSPILANLCAFQLDLRLAGLADTMGARYSRYADDLVFSGPASVGSSFDRLAAWVGRIALEEGYTVNHRKTWLASQATQQRVCGVVVNQHPNLPREAFDRLRALLHQCATHGPASQSDRALDEFRLHVLGRMTWAEQVNPSKARRLRKLFDRIVWDAAPAQELPQSG